MSNIPFQKIDWSGIEKTGHKGETGTAFWQTIQFGGLRLRIVEYSMGYVADHWCRKGMTYVVSDEMSSHRSVSKQGVKLLIIDGEFLKPQMEKHAI